MAGKFRSVAIRVSGLVAAALLLLLGCAQAPVSRPAPSGLPTPAPPAAAATESAIRPPLRDLAAGRPVRVLIGAYPKGVRLEGRTVRGWSARGTLVAEGEGGIHLAAQGDRIAWDGRTVLDSPMDVASTERFRVDGKPAPVRLRVTARKGQLHVVAAVPLEEYVASVLSREAPLSFRPEALAALSIAIRTYAVSAMEKPKDPSYDVVAGVEDQVFGAGDPVAAAFRVAAEVTRGEILTFNGGTARTAFHSTCGGRTESASEAWGSDVPYLRSVPCEDCRESPAWRWEYRMDGREAARVAGALGVRAGNDLRIEIVGRTATGRASRVRLMSKGVTREASAAAFRREAGYARVKSLKMEVGAIKGGFLFSGDGYGHGVGMCQWGANGMAARGKGRIEILARYYPGTTIAGGQR